MRFLKQSTSAVVIMGPFVDATDGVTPEDGLAASLTQAETRVSKNGGVFAAKNSSAAATFSEEGNYRVTIDATDTGLLGVLRIHMYVTGALPVWDDFMIVPANVYDSLFGASTLLVNASSASGTAPADIKTGVFAGVVEAQGSYTLQQVLSVMFAVLAGVTANNGALFKTPNGVSNRLTSTIDGSNNRTAQSPTP